MAAVSQLQPSRMCSIPLSKEKKGYYRKEFMHRYSIFLTLILLAFAGAQQKPMVSAAKKSAPAHASTPSASLPSEETVNAFMKQMFGYDAAITWKILEIKPSQAAGLAEVSVSVGNAQGKQNTTLYVTPDGEHAVIGEIIPFGAHPYAMANEKLRNESFGPARGAANAPVLLVEFSDLQCPHCKASQPLIDQLVAEEPNVKLVFQNFPLPSHDWAAKAAAYGDCIARSSHDTFWKFIQGTYDAQGEITASNADEKLKGIAEKVGAKSAEIAACADQPETIGRVQRSTALGRSVGVTSTPTVFLNGRKINSIAALPPDMLKKLVQFAATQGK